MINVNKCSLLIDESLNLMLSPDTLHSCGVYRFPAFPDDQSDIIEAVILSGNRRVSITRSIAEVIILTTDGRYS